MKKRIILVAIVGLSWLLMPMIAGAETSGTCGDNLTWTLDDQGVLTINGTGDMCSFSDNSTAAWLANKSSIQSVVIENGVTSIGCFAFQNCDRLTEIIIPDSVTNIGGRAFNNCTSLLSLTIPYGVPEIEDAAVAGCSSLTSISIPNSITSIGSDAFSGCISLTSITLPDSLTNIGYAAFWSCSGLTRITIPDHVTSIGDIAFNYCSSLTRIDIPATVTTFGSNIFTGCTKVAIYGSSPSQAQIYADQNQISFVATHVAVGDNLTWTLDDQGVLTISGTGDMYPFSDNSTVAWLANKSSIQSVVIEDGVTSVGNYAFRGCDQLLSVSFPDTLQSIGEYAFNECSQLISVSIPESVTHIGRNAFWKCSSLKSANIPSRLTEVPIALFSLCSSLESIVIPPNVQEIKNAAFWGCSTLTRITIPDHVTSIGDNAFTNCSNLTRIDIPATVTTIGSETFSYCSKLYIYGHSPSPAQTYAKQKGITFIATSGICGDELTWALCDDGILTISGSGEMYSYDYRGTPWYASKSSVRTVIIDNSVTSIGGNAFEGCSNVTDITIPDSITVISNATFSGCTNLTSITIPDGVTSIGEYAFYACSSLTNITIPDSVTGIGGGAFSGCSSLTSITIPDGVTIIEDSSFNGCSNLKNVTIPNNVTKIGHSVFSGCSSLTSIDIPDTVTRIEGSAFYGCTGLGKITIRGLLDYLGTNVFYNCTSLSEIEIMTPFPIVNNDSYPFTTCRNLRTVTILEGSITIPDNQFSIFDTGSSTSYSPTVNYVNAPRSLTNIGLNAFMDTILSTTLIVKCNSYIHQWARKYNHKYKAIEHQDPVIDSAVDPTCTTTGLTEGSHCNYCNDVIIPQETIEKLKHTLIEHPQVDTTHLQEGTRRYWECLVCGKLFSDHSALDEYEIEEPISIPIDPREGTWVSYYYVGELDDYSWTNYDYDSSFVIKNNRMIMNDYSYDIGQHLDYYYTFLDVNENRNGHNHRSHYVYSSGSDRIISYFTDTYKQNGSTHTSKFTRYYIREELRYLLSPSSSILYLPLEIVIIADEAFAGISAEEVCISAGCKSIGSKAFAYCSNLKVVIIPSSVSNIADDAFWGSSITIASYSDSYALDWALSHHINCINIDNVDFSQ